MHSARITNIFLCFDARKCYTMDGPPRDVIGGPIHIHVILRSVPELVIPSG